MTTDPSEYDKSMPAVVSYLAQRVEPLVVERFARQISDTGDSVDG
ncbi:MULTISPECIES: hypothetical protein [unclassified Streptomyces]|nr:MULTISPECIES: hypothetical protein [unclassified Streptomyces]